MSTKALDKDLRNIGLDLRSLRTFRTYTLLLQLSLVVLSGCDTDVVYRDNFDSTPIGQPPGPPSIGTSSVAGDVLIAENPMNDVSPDRWLQLRRVSAVGPLAQYVATLEEPITTGGTVALVGLVPAFGPITMSIYFEPPAFAPGLTLLHIDLLANGQIRVNDDTIEGTYQFDTTVGFLVGFNLDASPPMATLLVRGGGDDANTDVEVLAVAAGFGLGRVRVETPFEGVNSPPGRFFVNEVLATRRSEQ